jgi:Fe-S cluster assembly ATPase SufC
MIKGKIIKTGNLELIETLENNGYEYFVTEWYFLYHSVTKYFS